MVASWLAAEPCMLVLTVNHADSIIKPASIYTLCTLYITIIGRINSIGMHADYVANTSVAIAIVTNLYFSNARVMVGKS